jgi:hypothetical protein
MTEPISPELALVDPTLRASAISELPPPEAFDSARRRAPPSQTSRPAEWSSEAPPAGPTHRTTALPLAIAAYTATAIVRVLLFDLSVVLLLVLLIVALNVLR